MNYANHYNKLITHAISRTDVLKYTEKHHAIPKSLGGENTGENIVPLTPKEHFIAHLLLAKIYGGKMWYAAFMMSNMKKYTSKKYAHIRINHAKLMKEFNHIHHPKLPKEIRTYKCTSCGCDIERYEFIHKSPKKYYWCSIKCRSLYAVKNRASRSGVSIKGHPAWNRGKSNPIAAENGKRGASKLSKTATGRRKLVKPDGTWTWYYS